MVRRRVIGDFADRLRLVLPIYEAYLEGRLESEKSWPGRVEAVHMGKPLHDNVELYLALTRDDVGSRHRRQALGSSSIILQPLSLLHDGMTTIAGWDNDVIDKYGKATTAGC